MGLSHLVRQGKQESFRWSDTGKAARITRNIGEPKTIDMTTVHPDWLQNPEGLIMSGHPCRDGLPKGTEASGYILEQDLTSDKPYLKIQYVEAKR